MNDKINVNNIAAFGNELFCTAFRLGGITETLPVEMNKEVISKALSSIIDKDFALVIMQDTLLGYLSNKEKKLIEGSTNPLFTIISLKGDENTVEPIKVLVKKALGIELK